MSIQSGSDQRPLEWPKIDPVVYAVEGRRLQARAMADAYRAGWRALRHGLSGTAGWLRRHAFGRFVQRAREARAIDHLMALDDRLLSDIGLRRGDIPLAVRGSLDDPRIARPGRPPVAQLTPYPQAQASAEPANRDRPLDQQRDLAA